MNIHLFHGRNTLDEDMEDWGFDGPALKCEAVSFTYLTTITVHFSNQDDYLKAKELTGWKEWGELVLEAELKDDMLVANGKYYGDWSIQG